MQAELLSTAGKQLFYVGAMIARSDGQFVNVYSENGASVELAGDLYRCHDSRGYPMVFNRHHWRFKPKGLTTGPALA